MKYLSEIIDEKEVKKWKKGDKILISTPTGSGKTTAIFQILYPYALENDLKILYYCNRSVLKNQIKNMAVEYDVDDEVMLIKTYQQSEKRVINFDVDIYETLGNFDFVIFDEFHYIFTDAYNRQTDIFLDILINGLINSSLIVITATPEEILFVNKKFDKKYTWKQDYSFIEEISVYSHIKSLRYILANIPEGEKCIYIGKSNVAVEMKNEQYDSGFTCSKDNKKYKNERELESSFDSGRLDKNLTDIEVDQKFNHQFLFSTQVIDNGISLVDRDLKHIIIDQIDPTIFIQCLGRKRIQDGEKIKLYIKDYKSGSIQRFINNMELELEEIKELEKIGKDEFLTKRKRKSFTSAIFSDGSINMAHKKDLEYKLKLYQKPEFLKSYSEWILKKLNAKSEYCLRIDEDAEANMLETLLMRYEGKEIVEDDEKNEFRDKFFQCLIKSKEKINTNRRIGLHSMNIILLELKMEYMIHAKQKQVDNERKTYWEVKK